MPRAKYPRRADVSKDVTITDPSSLPPETRKPPSRRGEHLKAYRWSKGVSGNPGGMPADHQGLRTLALTFSREAILTLVGIMRKSESPGNAAFAAEAILNRAVGKPLQATAIVTGESAKESWDELILRLAREAGPSAPAAEVLAGEVLELERVDEEETTTGSETDDE